MAASYQLSVGTLMVLITTGDHAQRRHCRPPIATDRTTPTLSFTRGCPRGVLLAICLSHASLSSPLLPLPLPVTWFVIVGHLLRSLSPSNLGKGSAILISICSPDSCPKPQANDARQGRSLSRHLLLHGSLSTAIIRAPPAPQPL
jgi:hypothetical protein